VVENLRALLTYELAFYKLVHALDEKGKLDNKKLKEAVKDFKNAAKIRKKLKQRRDYLAACSWALRACILVAKNWARLLERARGFWELWRKTETRIKPTTEYLEVVTIILGEYLVYLAASGDKDRAERLLKERLWLLDYDPRVSVTTRLMLKLFGVGEGAKLREAVDTFRPQLLPEYLPALLVPSGRLQKDEALEGCAKFIPPLEASYILAYLVKSKAEVCVDAVAAATSNQVGTNLLRSNIEKVVPEAHLLLDKVDGRALVEILAPRYSLAQLVFMLLAAVEGRAEAVRLHGLLGSAAYRGTVLQPLFRAVYENCTDLNSEGCRSALLKLYHLHY